MKKGHIYISYTNLHDDVKVQRTTLFIELSMEGNTCLGQEYREKYSTRLESTQTGSTLSAT